MYADEWNISLINYEKKFRNEQTEREKTTIILTARQLNFKFYEVFLWNNLLNLNIIHLANIWENLAISRYSHLYVHLLIADVPLVLTN